jgi:Holliday junction resolvase
MKYKEQILRKYLHDIAIDQLADDYSSKGWNVTREEKIGKYQADLVVRKADKTIVFEVKAGKLTDEKKEQIEKLSDEIKKLGHEFRLILANPPKEREIEIIGLDLLFFDQFINDTPDELLQLSSRTIVDEVSDIEVDELIINDGKDIYVKGKGIVSVSLEWGPSDDNVEMDDSYPFTFEITLSASDKELKIVDILELSVDSSSFYE